MRRTVPFPAGPGQRRGRRYSLRQLHLDDGVVGALAQHQRRPPPRRQDVLLQVLAVDLRPDAPSGGDGLVVAQVGEAVEVAAGVLEDRSAEREEALHVPLLDVALLGVDVDGEVEVVADELAGLVADLQHVQALEDHDVGLADHVLLAGHDVVHDVAVDRSPHLGLAALHRGQEVEQAPGVVALGEALAVHEAAVLEHPVRVEEPVGGDEVDLRVVGPAREQRLQDAGEGALAHGDAAGHADDVGHLRRQRAEEGRRHLLEVLLGRHVEVQQAREREVDLGDLVERHPVVDAPQVFEVVLAQRQGRGGSQDRPLLPAEGQVPRDGHRRRL